MVRKWILKNTLYKGWFVRVAGCREWSRELRGGQLTQLILTAGWRWWWSWISTKLHSRGLIMILLKAVRAIVTTTNTLCPVRASWEKVRVRWKQSLALWHRLNRNAARDPKKSIPTVKHSGGTHWCCFQGYKISSPRDQRVELFIVKPWMRIINFIIP